jgi:hypothetical protein
MRCHVVKSASSIQAVVSVRRFMAVLRAGREIVGRDWQERLGHLVVVSGRLADDPGVLLHRAQGGVDEGHGGVRPPPVGRGERSDEGRIGRFSHGPCRLARVI